MVALAAALLAHTPWRPALQPNDSFLAHHSSLQSLTDARNDRKDPA